MLIQLQLAISRLFENLKSREGGQTMVEYGLILALIAVVVAVALTPLGKAVSDLIENVIASL
jgi:pilus assembly protein Flp/PilA